MAILDRFGNPATMSRRPSRHANLGGGDRPSESRNLRDLHKIVTKYDRQTLVSASKTLFLNSPLMVGALTHIATYSVGKAWFPVYRGEDKTFGEAAVKWLKDEWYPICNVIGDTADFQSDIYVDCISLDRDGEVFEYLTATKSGYPQIQIIPSHRIDNGELPDGKIAKGRYSGSQFELSDGIVYWKGTSQPVAYALVDEDGKHQEFIDKSYVRHVFDRYWPDQRRGMPLFFMALNNMRDIAQSEEWERMNLLSMSSLNYTIENESGGPDMDEPDYVAPSGEGDFSTQYLAGGRIMYARAGAGEKITQHQNFRPGNPWHEFFDMQARQCLIGAGLPASIWRPSGQGTSERNDVGKAARLFEDRQTVLDKIAKWRVTKAVAWAMANGRLPKSADWWNWGFTRPKKNTIDDGRTSKENLEKFRAGIMNATDLIGEEGGDFTETLNQRGEEAAMRELKRLEMNAKYGIELEKRDFLLLTPNEMAPKEEKTQTTQKDGND